MAPELGLEQRLGQAMQWLERGQLEQAAGALEQLVAEGLQSADLFGILADIRSRQERYDEAVTVGQKVLGSENAGRCHFFAGVSAGCRAATCAALSLGESLARSGELTGWGWALLCRPTGQRPPRGRRSHRAGAAIGSQSARVHNEQGELFQQHRAAPRDHDGLSAGHAVGPQDGVGLGQFGKALAHQGDQGGHRRGAQSPAVGPRLHRRSTACEYCVLALGSFGLSPSNLGARTPTASSACRSPFCLGQCRRTARPLCRRSRRGSTPAPGRVHPQQCGAQLCPQSLRLGDAQRALDCVDAALTTQRSPGGPAPSPSSEGQCPGPIERYGESVEAHGRANALLERNYDPEHFRAECTAVIEAYSSTNWPDLPRAQTAAPQTILIVGMPRSGTSLVETNLGQSSPGHGLGGVARNAFGLDLD